MVPFLGQHTFPIQKVRLLAFKYREYLTTFGGTVFYTLSAIFADYVIFCNEGE